MPLCIFKMFVKSDFFVDFYLEHSSDEKKRGFAFFIGLISMKIDYIQNGRHVFKIISISP